MDDALLVLEIIFMLSTNEIASFRFAKKIP